MTAREQAREAAINKAWSEGSEMVESGDGRLADLADAASDIWEPLVRELIAIATTPIRNPTLLDRVQEIQERL